MRKPLEHRLRVSISLALSALLTQAIYADDVCTSSSTPSPLTVKKGETCTISTSKEVDTPVINEGTIILNSSSSEIKFSSAASGGSAITIGNNGTDDRGSIQVTGSGTIDASASSANGLKIEGQDININEYRTLTIKAEKLTLGDSDKKLTTITGNSTNVTNTSNWGITLDSTTTLETKNVSFKDIRLSGSALTTLTNTNTTLNNAHIISTNSTGLTLSADASSSTFNIIGESNTISADKNELKIQGTHTFSGSGTLDFVGGSITLGDSGVTKPTLLADSTTADKEAPTLGFQADNKITFQELETSGLTLQIIRGGDSAVASNINSTFKNGTLQAIDVNGKDQVLVIENGNTEDSYQKIAIGTISITSPNSENSTTTFLGSGIKIYGQEITINNSATNTLALQTIEDNGEIVLGKKNSDSPTNNKKDGEVTIKGNDNTHIEKRNLQLRGATTTIGGSVTLQDLSIQTHSSNEGMVFSQGEDGSLTLNNINLTSGIKDDKGEGNYQSLSFTSENTGGITLVDNTSSTLNASEFAFTNQNISLANGGSGSTLKLYAYGKTSLDNPQANDALGLFSFDSTTISDGSTSTLFLCTHKGAKLSAYHLTLDGVAVESKLINGTSGSDNAPIDLSSTSNDITIKNSVSITASKFLYGDTQGIGADITIIGQNGSGSNLALTATDTSSASDRFVFGGTLTFDNSASSATSTLTVKLGDKENDNSTKKGIDLIFNGGLTAIGNATNGGTTTLKAKSFTFKAGSIVSSINGTLSFEADSSNSGDIDLSQALTLLQGDSNAEATISKGSGTLSIGDVLASGKTKIENATFIDSNIQIRSIGGNNTLTISGSTPISGIQSVDLADANLDVKNGTSQDLQIKVDGNITSNGTSTITASTITAGNGSNGTYSVNVESGTLTFKETGTAGDGIGSLTLGTEGKQGGNLVLTKGDNANFNTLKTAKITSYQTSNITADSFDFSDESFALSSSGGTLTLSAKSASDLTLNIKSGVITLDNGGLAYDCFNHGQNLGGIKFYDDTVALTTNQTIPTSIVSKRDSFIQGNSLAFKDNEITSSGGMLTLKGLSADSILGAVTINNNGGLTATDSSGATATSIKLSSTLTLTANAPYVSSSSPLGGGKFGVLQAQSVNFTQGGGVDSPLIHIKVLDKTLEGEELFTLQEGGQVVVWTTEGITKGNGNKEKITLDDISVDSGGYKSLSLTAQLLPDTTTATQINAIQVNLSVTQNSASELTEGIGDETAKKQMQAILGEGSNKTIIDSILGSSSNPLKAGFAENIIQGNTVVVGNALDYIHDSFQSISQSIHLNDRIQTQIVGVQTSIIEGRLARQGNPHHATAELAKFIRSYHNTRYASSDDELFAEEEPSQPSKGSLWVSYDGGLATGNGSNSTINGLSAGYDHSLSSQFLLGGFINYAYGAFDGTYIHNNSHNIGLGLYTRMYFGNNEVDLVLSENIGLVTSQVNVGNTTMPSLLNGTMQYNLYRTNVMTRYGYTFKVGDEESPYYLKPIVGVNMSYTYQDDSATDAVASVTMSKVDFFKLDMSVGMEMRKYINEGTYLFIMPLIERDIFANSCDVNVGFVDSQNLSYTLDYLSQTSVSVYAGGEGNLTENLALSGSLGVKVGIEKSEVLTNWSVGLKYKF